MQVTLISSYADVRIILSDNESASASANTDRFSLVDLHYNRCVRYDADIGWELQQCGAKSTPTTMLFPDRSATHDA